jgi:phage terminase large subunit
VQGRRLFFEYESGGTGLELDQTAPQLRRELPGIEAHAVRADNARPESISYLKRHGLPGITACEKGKGSVEDGIAHMKQYDEIIVHPRCERTQNEFMMYSYKVDRLSGDILPQLVDANNHFIDAARYGLEPLMRARRGFFG